MFPRFPALQFVPDFLSSFLTLQFGTAFSVFVFFPPLHLSAEFLPSSVFHSRVLASSFRRLSTYYLSQAMQDNACSVTALAPSIFSRPYQRSRLCYSVASVCRLSVTLCIVAKRCVLEQKLLSRAYRKSYMRNRLVPK